MNTYFAFGSNMAQATLHERSVAATRLGAAFVADYRLAFTLPSQRWTGNAADLLPDPGGLAWGVLWEMSDPNALDPFELRYDRVPVEVTRSNGNDGTTHRFDAFTYLVKPENRTRNEGSPATAYLERMLEGAGEAGLPEEYLQFLQAFRSDSSSPRIVISCHTSPVVSPGHRREAP